jgi:DNA-binding PadR family transcriptional regulator
MRRKPGALLGIELNILDAALDLRRRGTDWFYGFLLAGELKHHANARNLTSYGTLYKALERMERAGLLSSRWEDHTIAEQENRPRRRLYEITAAGEAALVAARTPSGSPVSEAARP